VPCSHVRPLGTAERPASDFAPNGRPTEGRWLAAVDCFAEVANRWLEPAIAVAGPLYFAVPHASVFVTTPTDFSNRILDVDKKNIMAAGWCESHSSVVPAGASSRPRR
jgi:hypothetical protein